MMLSWIGLMEGPQVKMYSHKELKMDTPMVVLMGIIMIRFKSRIMTLLMHFKMHLIISLITSRTGYLTLPAIKVRKKLIMIMIMMIKIKIIMKLTKTRMCSNNMKIMKKNILS